MKRVDSSMERLKMSNNSLCPSAVSSGTVTTATRRSRASVSPTIPSLLSESHPTLPRAWSLSWWLKVTAHTTRARQPDAGEQKRRERVTHVTVTHPLSSKGDFEFYFITMQLPKEMRVFGTVSNLPQNVVRKDLHKRITKGHRWKDKHSYWPRRLSIINHQLSPS